MRSDHQGSGSIVGYLRKPDGSMIACMMHPGTSARIEFKPPGRVVSSPGVVVWPPPRQPGTRDVAMRPVMTRGVGNHPSSRGRAGDRAPTPASEPALPFMARDHTPTRVPGVTQDVVRTSLLLPAATRTGLRRLALETDTTMSGLIRAAVHSGLADVDVLVAASFGYRRIAGVRTTLDLPRGVHRKLKALAIDNGTSVQALISASIGRAYPELQR